MQPRPSHQTHAPSSGPDADTYADTGAAPMTGAGRAAPPATSTLGRHAWVTPAQWRQGDLDGTSVHAEGHGPPLRFERPAGVETVRDPRDGSVRALEYASWLSPERMVRTPANELLVSWNADTPIGTAVRVEVRATYRDGGRSPWYVLAVWAAHDGPPYRGSVAGQGDGVSAVRTDTLAITDRDASARVVSYRCRLTLLRQAGSDAAPAVHRLDVLTSDVPDRFDGPHTSPGPTHRAPLPVPTYSQTPHYGRYPEYNGGGEAWCSPTSTQMVVEYWGGCPSPEELAWVDPAHDDPQVCHAARATYDPTYGGCGNWPFNTAYAATRPGVRAVVTRLDTLTDVELLVAAGIPVIVSQPFDATELDGAGYDTAGHLLVVVGFTADGDVVVNDPAAPDNATVRRVYDRRQFETVWLRTRRRTRDGATAPGTGGVCYLVFPSDPSAEQGAALATLGLVQGPTV